MENLVKQWMQNVDQIFSSLKPKEIQAAEEGIRESLGQFPLEKNEAAIMGTYLDKVEPKGAYSSNIVLLASPRRMVFSEAGGWMRAPWTYWNGMGAISSLAISGWMFQQSYGYNHISSSYLRLDFMFKNLNSLTFYKGFDQPRELVPLAKIVNFVVISGANVTNNSQEFEMAFNAIQ